MFNLLSAGFYRIRKNKVFWGSMFVMAVWSVIICVEHWKNFMADYDGVLDEVSFMDSMFQGQSMMILALAVFVSIFLGTEYGDGTIRNKLIAGHTRGNIYFSQFLVSSGACILVYLVSIGVAALLGFILLGGTDMPPETVLLYCGTGALMCIADAAIFTWIAMAAGSKTVGAVICLLTGVFFFSGAGAVYEPLSWEEYFYQPKAVYEATLDKTKGETSVVVIGEDEDTEMVKLPNPYYISGNTRKYYEFLLDCNPVGQAVQLGDLDLERPLNVIIYDLVEIVLCCGAGMVLFCRKDLK